MTLTERGSTTFHPIDVRLRTVISDEELAEKVGKIVTDDDYNVLLTGPARLRKPDGSLLGIYLPGALSPTLEAHKVIYPILHGMRGIVTDNRGDASGSKRFRYGDEKRTRTKRVSSVILGSFDAFGPTQFCRQTSWTHKNLARWGELWPYFQAIAAHFAEHVPDRYAKQMEYADNTNPDWLIPNTPFTTITVNNTYPTGVHTDKGDLETGFSMLSTLRRGEYSGGVLVLPKFRIGVDMKDGDLIMFDAHEHHGNTNIYLNPERPQEEGQPEPERISVVSYYRTGMVECGSADAELRKAQTYAERRGGVLEDADE